MQETSVFLIVKSGEEEERILTDALERYEDGASVFRFCSNGGHFVLKFGKTVSVQRTGDISYSIELDPCRVTRAEIATGFGKLYANVETLRAQVFRGNELKFEGEYIMDFDGFKQRHEVRFRAKELRRTEK